jgi:Holliday junction resolvase RusA-like endonuclease
LYRAFLGKGMKYPRSILSTEAREKRAKVCAHIINALKGRPMLTCPLSLHYTIVPRDKRIPDIDFIEKHLLDCLQHAGVVANDRVICHITKERLAPCSPGWIDLTLTEVA